MSHITHFKKQPVNVQYWDYYILCHLNTDATIALQRMEYWDGTKEDANIHAENINDALIQQGQEPTQDTSNWIYKSGDELQWELMGVAGERRLPKLLTFLIKDLQYLAQRNNPSNTWDRKKQYCFQRKLIQQHINYLGYIIDYFDLSMARLTVVFYAIELLTGEKCYIDKLSVELVLERIEIMKSDERLPHFLKNELVKFSQTYSTPDFTPFRNFAEWKAQNCGMHSAEMRDRNGKNAESIPQKCGSNSIEDYHNETNIEDKHNKGNVSGTTHVDASTTSQNPLSEKNEEENTTPPTTSQEQLTTTPTSQGNAPRRSVGSRKSKQSKKDQARELLKASEIAAPQKPDPTTHPYNGELFMELADFYRGTKLPESSQPNSQYMQAVNAAASLVQRKAKFEDVDKVFRFLLGRDKVKDEKWIAKGYYTDLWIVARHLSNKLLEYRNVERQTLAPSNKPQTAGVASELSHDEAVQLANTVVAQAKEHGMNIQARATSTNSNAWVVSASWDGDKLQPITSPALWNKYFAELRLVAEDYAAEQKGAR